MEEVSDKVLSDVLNQIITMTIQNSIVIGCFGSVVRNEDVNINLDDDKIRYRLRSLANEGGHQLSFHILDIGSYYVKFRL